MIFRNAVTAAFVSYGFALIIGGWFAAVAGEALDTTRLPRLGGGKEVFASPPNTIYTTQDPVAAASEAVAKALTADGWQRYVAPFTAQASDPGMALQSYKRGSQAVAVYIAVAPAQGNATSVNYSVVPLATDLPFPKDATGIEFDPNRPHLNCMTAGAVDATLDFYRAELAGLGWSPWTGNASGQPDNGTAADALVYFVREAHEPLQLVLQRGEDGRTKVELKGVPAELLKPVAKVAKAETPASAVPAEPKKDAFDTLAEDMLKQAQQIAHDAIAEAGGNAKPKKADAAPPPAEKSEDLQPLAGNTAPVPVPSTAEGVDYEATDGTLEFSSSSSVASVAAFYRNSLKPLGWKESKSVINKSNMVVLNFAKAGKDLSFTIMQMGQSTNVSGNGSGLVTASDEPAADTAGAAPEAGTSDRGNSAVDTPSKQLTEKDLEADEGEGLPVPKEHSYAGHSSTPFRVGADASVPAGVEAVLGFYRRELGKRDWKEDTASSVVKADSAVAKFTTPDGPGILTLGRKNNETTVDLLVRKEAEAKKSGQMPGPGKAKILLGNILDSESTITINKQTIKVKAEAGTKGPDGPSLELAPGKYAYSIKSKGKPEQKDEFEVKGDEIWGLMIGPGGGLALQMY